jgi:ATP-dependent Lon protease
VGVIGTVLQLLRLPDGTVKALIEGKQRARIAAICPNPEFFEVELDLLPDIPGDTIEVEALMRAVIDDFTEYASINKSISKELLAKVSAITDPSKLADSVASHFSFKLENKQHLLETADLGKRLALLVKLIKLEIEVYQMDQRIKGRVKEQMEKTQKNYYLNEQMRAIKKEMGSDDDTLDELKDLEKKIKRKRMSKEAARRSPGVQKAEADDAHVGRSHGGSQLHRLDDQPALVRKSRHPQRHLTGGKILNEDHYGLEKPKERILEYLAVQTLVQKIGGRSLCLVGPPGVGKTSLAKSVARATGRKFVRMSLGGVRDEAEIRGHRRTYIGAMPGKIIQSLKKTGVNNPVFCLDEVDKMSMDFRGDPSAALLEVLDPEQNYSFNDHYLDLDYDLSDILFITTANTLPDIPLPLQDRMEIIRLPGYTEYEKYNIAKEFLVPNRLPPMASKKDINFSKAAIYTDYSKYTREAGVRNLEREISSICRKPREVVNKKEEKKHVISATTMAKMLGPPRFKISQIEEKDQIGLVTGLAWTQVGGELLCVETADHAGQGQAHHHRQTG